MIIAGNKTVQDWQSIRNRLTSFDNEELWESVFNEYFLTRLKYRYLNPINLIKSNGKYIGEGFSIMTIICSMIEFLESTYQGLNYRYVAKEDKPLSKFEYSKSRELFIDFLSKRKPFCNEFNEVIANEFYRNVRCGLLHEARTKGEWTIWGSSDDETLIKKSEGKIIIYRNNFHTSLLNFINEIYKNELMNSKNRKKAFLRKFDNLCQT